MAKVSDINMLDSKKYTQSILVVGHITEIYGPVQALTNHLKKYAINFELITHPFSYSNISNSKYQYYLNSALAKKHVFMKVKGPDVIHFIKDFLLTFLFVIKLKKKYDIYIGIDNLNAFTGIILHKFRIVNKMIFYVIDYTPKRFENKIMNYLYHKLDFFCVKHSDYVWNISKRIAEIRKKQGIEQEKNIVVNVGVELDKIEYSPRIDRNKLVFVSHLTKSKGVQLIIDAMKDIVEKVPDAKLEIIGTGPYEYKLREMVIEKGLNENIKFIGAMEHDELFKYLPKCGIALATYTEDPNSITYYADPTKPKEYLACGLPVIITRVPWIAEEIEKRQMGIAINYDKEELVDAAVKLLTHDEFFKKCKENALEFASGLSWNKIYDEAFRQIVY